MLREASSTSFIPPRPVGENAAGRETCVTVRHLKCCITVDVEEWKLLPLPMVSIS